MEDAEKTLIHHDLRPELRGLVNGIAGYRECGHGLTSSPEFASLTIPLVIGFRAPFLISFGKDATKSKTTSFTSGLFPGPVFIDSAGEAECVQINFTPLGARRFFDLPMSEIGGALIEFAAIADPKLRELRRRLGEMNDLQARLRLTESFVIDRLRSRLRTNREATYAFGKLTGSAGAMRISEITDDLGWSRKRLSRVFYEEIGETPKTIARIARFQNALHRLQISSDIDLAILAADCGYSDQAHMTREFAEFSGQSPGALRSND